MLFSWGCSMADTWTLLWGTLEEPRDGEMEQQLFQQSAFVSNEPFASWFFEGDSSWFSKRRLRFPHRWGRRWEDEGLETRHCDKGKCDEVKLFFHSGKMQWLPLSSTLIVHCWGLNPSNAKWTAYADPLMKGLCYLDIPLWGSIQNTLLKRDISAYE